MKTIILLAGVLLTFVSFSARAQMQTLVVSPANTNSAIITVSSNSYAVVKSVHGDFELLFNMQGLTFTNDVSTQSVKDMTIRGPATIQLRGNPFSSSFATIDVVPGLFPPGKTLTVGSYSGNVQVTMKMSTDLVNWTPAVNGTTYTNSPDARFFRIEMDTNP